MAQESAWRDAPGLYRVTADPITSDKDLMVLKQTDGELVVLHRNQHSNLRHYPARLPKRKNKIIPITGTVFADACLGEGGHGDMFQYDKCQMEIQVVADCQCAQPRAEFSCCGVRIRNVTELGVPSHAKNLESE